MGRQKQLRQGYGQQNSKQPTKQAPPTNKGKHQNLSKTDHGEKVKQAQALTYVCN